MAQINLTSPADIKLKTAGKYCEEDIEVVQNLEEISAEPTEEVQEFVPSEGKSGISKFVVQPIITETKTIKSGETERIEYPSEGKYIGAINVLPIKLQSKTITPSKEPQTIVADNGNDAIKSIKIEAIPDEYIIPKGTLNIDENGLYNVKDKESVNVVVPGEVVNLQDKSVTPTKEVQNVTADQGYTGLRAVEVEAIPNEYIIPSGNIDVNSNQVVDVTQYSQATISVPTGGGEDLIGSMMAGIPVDYVDTQRSVTSVPYRAMYGYNNYLNSIELPVCSEIGGEAFRQDLGDISTLPPNYLGITKISLPECIMIGAQAFQKCYNLSEIYCPKVQTIYSSAFLQCKNLKSLNLPEVTTLGVSVFMQCSSISTVHAPKLKSVGAYAFNGIYDITEYSFPNLTYVSNGAFNNDQKLVTFYAPSLSNLATVLFAGCTSLSSLVIDYSNLSQVPSSCFAGCLSLSSFNAPNCFVINSYGFNNCSELQSVSFPTCSSLGMGAFRSCYSLSEAVFPECTFLGNEVFYSCSGLTKAYFPKLSLDANRGCFMGCTSLTDVSLPLCKAILSSAFSNCINLSSLNLPVASLIGSGAFTNCSSLSALILGSTSVVKLSASTAFNSTPMKLSSYLGYFGSIYVPSDLVASYKTATNWTYYSDRITSIDNLPTT